MPTRPRDPNQLAKLIVDIATGEVEDSVSDAKRTLRVTPAMAAGISDHVWPLEEIAALAPSVTVLLRSMSSKRYG